jgi:hypothetical protein
MPKLIKGGFPFVSLLILLGLALTNFLIQIGVDPSYKDMSTDSGTFAYCGQVIRAGGLMYRDCWDNKPPGVYYLNAVAIWLGGSNPFAIWLFQAVWLTLAVFAYFLILRKIWDHQGLAALAAFVLLFVLLYPDIFQGGNLTETYDVLLVVLALGAFWAYLRTGRRRWLAALGLLFAAGSLLKPTYIAVGLAAGAVIACLDFRRRQYKTLFGNLALLGFTAFLPLALVCLYWVWQDDFNELWFAVFVHNFTYVREGFSLRSLYGTARMFLINQPMAALTVLTVMSFGVFIYQQARAIFTLRPPAADESSRFAPGSMDIHSARVWWQAGLGLALVLDVFFLAASGKNFGHYLQVLLPGMVASLLYLLDTLRQSIRMDNRERSLRVVALSAILMVSLAGGLEIAKNEMPNLEELKAFYSSPDLTIYHRNELEQYIVDHSQPSDSVLAWTGHPSMNFIAHRRSPTRYIFLQHLFTPTPYDQNGLSEFLQELETDPPVLIVAQPDSSAGLPFFGDSLDRLCIGCEPDIREKMLTFKQFVESNYQLVYKIWDWVVYEHIR